MGAMGITGKAIAPMGRSYDADCRPIRQDSPPAVTFSCAIGHRGDPLPGRVAQEARAEQDGGDHQPGDPAAPHALRAPAPPKPAPGPTRPATAPGSPRGPT